MGDDEYWNSSEHKGFNFGDVSNRRGASDAVDQFPYGGSQKHLVKEIDFSGAKGAIPLDPSSDSLKHLLLRGDILRLTQKDKPVSGRTTPKTTVMNILFGLSYCLEQHKALDEKIALLDAAIKSHDGNAIIAVVLFLRNTLKKSIFHHEVLHKPVAVSHYMSYLEMDHEYDELANLLLMLGKAEEAAMLKYKAATREKNPENKIKKLENCLNTHFQITFVPAVLADSLSEHISLLQRQLPIEDDDVRQEKEGTHQIFLSYPRKHTLLDVSVITTLFYCCFYHYNLSENNLASPAAIRKQHQLTDKQFTWTALSALAKLRDWVEVENLFISKSWLGSTKLKCCIGFNKAVPILIKGHAPAEIVFKYIRLIDDADERLNLAKKHKFHRLVLEILITMRDRQGLQTYKSELSPKSVEHMEVEEILYNSITKWKN